MATYYSPKIVTDGLVFLADIGNAKSYQGSGTSLYNLANSSGSALTIPAGVSYGTASPGGGYLNFSGTNSVISTGVNQASNFATGGQFTLAAFIKTPTTFYKSYLGHSQHVQHGFMLGMQSGVHRMVINNSGSGFSIDGPAPNNSSIEFICGTHASRVLKLYYNGSLYSQGTASFDWVSINADMYLGYGNQGGWDPYIGYIHIAYIYNRALSATEILQNYNALRGRFGL